MSESDTLKTPVRQGVVDYCNICDDRQQIIAKAATPELAAALVNAVNGAGFTPIGITPDEASVAMAEALDEANGRVAVLEAGLRKARELIIRYGNMNDPDVINWLAEADRALAGKE